MSIDTQSTIEGLKGASTIMVASMALSMLVVLCMKRPKTQQEWVIGIVSTIVSSLCGGAAVLLYLDVTHWVESYIGLLATGGVIFACGLPGWAVVRLLFNTLHASKDKTIPEVVKEVKGSLNA